MDAAVEKIRGIFTLCEGDLSVSINLFDRYSRREHQLGCSGSAHLWAAFRTWEKEGKPAEFSPRIWPDGIMNFLALSEEIRRLGEACFARSQKAKHGPILDPAITWRPPSDLDLPDVIRENPPLPEQTLKLLRNYRVNRGKE